MGVAADHHIRLHQIQQALEAGVRALCVQVLVDAARAAVDQRYLEIAQPERDGGGQAAQEGFVGLRRVRVRPRDRALAERFRFGSLVRAAAVGAAVAHALVVVTHQRGDLARPDGLHHLVGKRAIAHQIAQAAQVCQAARPHILKNGLQRGPVGVNVAKDGQIVHGLSLSCRRNNEVVGRVGRLSRQ